MRALLLAGLALAVLRGGDLGEAAGGDSVVLLPSRSRPYVCGERAEVRRGHQRAGQLRSQHGAEAITAKITHTTGL